MGVKETAQERLTLVFTELVKTGDAARTQGHFQEASLALQLASQVTVTARFLEDHSHSGGGARGGSILGMEDEDDSNERAAW